MKARVHTNSWYSLNSAASRRAKASCPRPLNSQTHAIRYPLYLSVLLACTDVHNECIHYCTCCGDNTVHACKCVCVMYCMSVSSGELKMCIIDIKDVHSSVYECYAHMRVSDLVHFYS